MHTRPVDRHGCHGGGGRGAISSTVSWTESPLVAAYFALKPGGFLVAKKAQERVLMKRDAALYGLPYPPMSKSLIMPYIGFVTGRRGVDLR